MTGDASNLMNGAREAMARGDRKAAQQILADILKRDSRNINAWLLLADILENPQHRIESLRRVLQISPDHIVARQRLDQLLNPGIEGDRRQHAGGQIAQRPPIQEQSQPSGRPAAAFSVEKKQGFGPPANLSFKFRFVRNKRVAGFFAGKAVASATSLDLQGERVSYQDLLGVTSRDDVLVLNFSPSAGLGEKLRRSAVEDRFLVLKIYDVKANEIKRPIDRYLSAVLAEKHREKLTAEGKGDRYEAIACPHCRSTIDLSEEEAATYVYCRYCDSILTRKLEIVSDGDAYGICDECKMFGRLQGYTLFFFYFLLVVYGYSIKHRFVCDNCAIRLAKRALLVNLIFLLGVPSAIYMWVKAATGHPSNWGALTQANELARQGKYREADEIYYRLLSQYPDHPGLLFNQGLGHLKGNDISGARGFLGRSLRTCSTYVPSAQLLYQIDQVQAQAGTRR